MRGTKCIVPEGIERKIGEKSEGERRKRDEEFSEQNKFPSVFPIVKKRGN